MRTTVIATAFLTVLLCASVEAQTRPEDAIAYRQSVYKMVSWNFGVMLEMVRNQRPFDDEEFRRRALRVANLSNQALEGFPDGSNSGAVTDASAAIWSNREDFESRMLDWRLAARALYEVSLGEDRDAKREQFMATAATCKACHDEYRE